ncbi:hypothetical protein AQBE111736_08270 [Aquirufa beregesia]
MLYFKNTSFPHGEKAKNGLFEHFILYLRNNLILFKLELFLPKTIFLELISHLM